MNITSSKTIHLIVGFFTVFLFSSWGICQSSTSLETKDVRFLDTVYTRVLVENNIAFGKTVNNKGEYEDLLLDVYKPIGDNHLDRPVIIWLHGGGFRYGYDKSQRYIVSMATRFAQRGYVSLSINYRVREDPRVDKKGTMADALEDAMKGLEWLRNNHENLGVDIHRIIIAGGSAGGMLAANLCYMDGSDSEPWNKEGIIGFVNLWGSPDKDYTFFRIDQSDPPTIIVHGTADKTRPYESSIQLIKELAKHNVLHELVTIEGAGHTPAIHMDDFVINVSSFLYDLVRLNTSY